MLRSLQQATDMALQWMSEYVCVSSISKEDTMFMLTSRIILLIRHKSSVYRLRCNTQFMIFIQCVVKYVAIFEPEYEVQFLPVQMFDIGCDM